jgi:hypothetical protein
MLNPEFKQYANAKKIKFPLENQLSLTFNAEEIVLCTPILKFYLENGLQITKLHFFVEYKSQEPFKPFVNKMVKMRIKATEESNKLHTSLSKIVMNSSWVTVIKRSVAESSILILKKFVLQLFYNLFEGSFSDEFR